MNWQLYALGILLLAMPDTPRVARLLPATNSPAQLPPGETLPVLPELQAAVEQNAKNASIPKTPPKRNKGDALQPMSRLEIIRYVSGEFARVRKPLPAGKNSFRYAPDKPLNEAELRRMINKGGSAANPGDSVQITQILFKTKEIVVDINGGGRGKRRLRDHLQLSLGGMPVSTASSGPTGYQAVGCTLILDFGRPLPDMTPDELKEYLGPLLDFSKQRSATVNWVETLPPEFQAAIKARKAVVGMDREMVVAAMGRPERKVRERDDDGMELEDWIYGDPPSKTIFVTFAGEKVIRVKEFPR